MSEQPPTTAVRPSESEAFWFWLKLGCISFGGPAGQIAIMHDELVERRRWISERRFLHALNFCMALPGPEAQQLASYIGYSHVRRARRDHRRRPVRGAGVRAAVRDERDLRRVRRGTVVAGVVRGLGAAVIALVAAAVIRVGGRVIHTAAGVAMAAAAFVPDRRRACRSRS